MQSKRNLRATDRAKLELRALDEEEWRKAIDLLSRYADSGQPVPRRNSTLPANTLVLTDPPIVFHLMPDYDMGVTWVTHVFTI